MKKLHILCAALALATLGASAFATDNKPTPAPVTNNAGGAGGAGGLGGNGGAGGSGGAGGQGGSALQGQLQGQAQGQGQAQSSRNTNTNRNNATANSANYNGASSSNSAYIGGTSVRVEGAAGDTVVYEAQARNPVATAYAAPLTASNGTCMGSSSAGGQGAAFGLSIGTTWTDNNCDIRYDAEALRAAGLPGAAQARLCQKAEIAKAMDAAGTPCSSVGGGRRAEAILNGTKVAEAPLKAEQFTDPIVRARLGLPPLK